MTDDVYWILVPQMLISLASWAQLVLSMNRFRVDNFPRSDLWALVILLHSGFVRWVAALAVQTSTLAFQMLVAFVAAALGWTSFVIIFNEGFLLPTRQQTAALGMSLLVTTMWEVNNRVVVNL